MITATTDHNGAQAYNTEYRGTAYYLYFCAPLNQWQVQSNRKALGRGVGTARFFASLADVAANIKAFRGIDQLAAL